LLDSAGAPRHIGGLARMPTSPPPSGDPFARGSVIHGFRAAVVEIWGEDGLREVADRLPVEARVATIEKTVLPIEWVSVRHVVAWHEALWDGPVRRDEAKLAQLVSRSIDLGFGRVKSAFFAGITADRLRDRAPELWRWQHTHGVLTVDTMEAGRALISLRGHPYVDNAASRRVTAESYRAILALAGAREVRAAWGMEASSLVVHLSWR
jgi:hypothetical protein